MSALALTALVLLAPASSEVAPAPQSARACPALFGDAARVKKNAAQRAQEISGVERSRSRDVLRHQVGRWRKPKPTRLEGVAFEGVVVAESPEAPRGAVVRLSGALAELCGEGPFLLHADDAIGARVRVLSVLKDGVLLEQDNKLRTFEPTGKKLALELVYSSSFMIVPGEGGGGGASAKGNARSRGRSELTAGTTTKAPMASMLKATADKNRAAALARRNKLKPTSKR